MGDPANDRGAPDANVDVEGFFTAEEWADAAHNPVTIEEVRRALSTITGSLSSFVVAMRK